MNKEAKIDVSKLDMETITSRVSRGHSLAITLDTSIFERNHLNLEGGLLGEMQQFATSDVRFIISDVIAREVVAHLEEKASSSLTALQSALKSLSAAWLVSRDQLDEAFERLTNGNKPHETAMRRWRAFAEMTGCEIVGTADFGDAVRVLQAYFGGGAPFAKKDKKHEFPDAFALTALERWAEEHHSTIIAVSADGGWHDFCAQSSSLCATDDLGHALSLLHQNASLFALRLWSLLVEDEDAFQIIRRQVEAQLDRLDVGASADSEYLLEENIIDISLSDLQLQPGSEERPIEIINKQSGSITARLMALAELNLVIEFDFYAQRPDRSLSVIGQTARSASTSTEIELLVTFSDDLTELSVLRVDLSPRFANVLCGFVEPDWVHDRS